MMFMTMFLTVSIFLPCTCDSSNAGVPIERTTDPEVCPTSAVGTLEPSQRAQLAEKGAASGSALLQRAVARQARRKPAAEHEEIGAPAPTPSPNQAISEEVPAELAKVDLATTGNGNETSFIRQLAEQAASLRLAAGERTMSAMQVFGEALTRRREAANLAVVVFGIIFVTVVLSLAMYWFSQLAIAGMRSQEPREEARLSTQPPPMAQKAVSSSLPPSTRNAPGRAAQEVLGQFEKRERGLPAAAPGEAAALPIDPATSMPADDIMSMIFIVPEAEGQSLQLRGEFTPWEQDGEGTVHRLDPQHTPIASLKMCEKGGSGKGILISPMHRLSHNPPVGFIDTANAVNNRGLAAPFPRFVTLQAVSEGWKHRPVAIVHKDDKVEGRFLVRKYSQKFDGGAVLLIIIKGQDLRIQDAYFRLIATVDTSRLDRTARTLNIAHGIDASLVFSSVIAVAKLS